MTIVTINGHYYIPFMDGFKEINRDQVMYLYEQGYITHEEDLTNEYCD